MSRARAGDPVWTGVVVFLAAAAAGIRFFVPILDPDQGWLRWAGERILAGEYPRWNAISWTTPEEPWTLHETVPAVAYGLVPLPWLPTLRGALLLAIAGVALRLARGPAGNAVASAIGLGAWLVAAQFSMSERAMTWGLLALAVEVAVLARSTHPARFAGAAAVVVLWASTHGSFVIGLAVLALAHPGWAAAAAVGCLANPHGPAIYALVAGYVTGAGTQGRLGTAIPEWAWLDPREPAQLLSFLAFALPALAVLRYRRDPRSVLLVALGFALGLRSWRNLPLAATFLLPLVVDTLEDRLPLRPLGRTGPAYAAAALGLLLLSPLVPARDPVTPEVLAAIPAGARVWNDHGLGGWLGRAGVPVFWDGRNDCYPPEVFDEGVLVEVAAEGALARLDARGVGAVVTCSAPLVALLGGAGWEARHADGLVTVLVRPGAGSAPER